MNELLQRIERLEKQVQELRELVVGGQAVKVTRFCPPTMEEVKLAAAKAGLPDSEAEKFFYFYESKAWKVGKNPMKSVGAAIGGWAARWRENGHRSKSTFDLKTIMEAKQSIANDLKARHSFEAAMGTVWDDQLKRDEWLNVTHEIRDIKTQLSQMI